MGDKVFLKVSPIMGIRRLDIRGNLSPKCIGPYETVKKLNTMAYRLNLLTGHEHVDNVFHISQLRKFVPDLNHIIDTEPIEIVYNLAYKPQVQGTSLCTWHTNLSRNIAKLIAHIILLDANTK